MISFWFSVKNLTNQKHANVQLCPDMFHDDFEVLFVFDSFLNRISHLKTLQKRHSIYFSKCTLENCRSMDRYRAVILCRILFTVNEILEARHVNDHRFYVAAVLLLILTDFTLFLYQDKRIYGNPRWKNPLCSGGSVRRST